MKIKSLFSIALLAAINYCAHAQFSTSGWITTGSGSGVAASQAEVNAGVENNKFVSPATLAGAGYTLTNGAPISGLMPFVLWNDWTDWDYGTIWGTNAPQPLRNGPYIYTTAMNGWTNPGGIFITNWNGTSNAFSGRYTLHATVSGAISWSNLNTSLFSTNWLNVAAGTNLNFSTFFRTNALWRLQTYGAITNWLDYSNGVGGVVYSNGAAYQVTSRVGATNKSWSLISAAP